MPAVPADTPAVATDSAVSSSVARAERRRDSERILGSLRTRGRSEGNQNLAKSSVFSAATGSPGAASNLRRNLECWGKTGVILCLGRGRMRKGRVACSHRAAYPPVLGRFADDQFSGDGDGRRALTLYDAQQEPDHFLADPFNGCLTVSPPDYRSCG